MFNNNSLQDMKDKLAVLLALNSFGDPVIKSDFSDFIIENDIVQYFQLQELLISLVEGKLTFEFTEENKSYLMITEDGRIVLEFFKEKLAVDLHNTIIDLVAMRLERNKPKNKTVAYYELQPDNRYEVTIVAHESNKEVLNLKLYVSSEDQAKIVVNNWNENSVTVYGKIISAITSI